MPVEIVPVLVSANYAEQVRRAADFLLRGQVVVMPTETVYGAFGLLENAAARDRLTSLRGASESKPLTIHLASPNDALQFIGSPGELANRLMRKLWPGPVGLQFKVPLETQREVIESVGVEGADLYDGDAITLRCPDHRVFTDVASLVKKPLVATQAGGGQEPMAAMAQALGDKVDLILDAGPPRFAKPSTLIRINGDTYTIARAGVYDDRIIQKLLKTTILFVCSGNTCRSPMAEALARKVIAMKLSIPQNELEVRGYEVLSAGAMAYPGARATPEAVEAVAGLGADLSRHRSQPLSVEMIHQADHIFAMSRGHLRAVLAMAPSAADKTQTLDPESDIEDPIGGDISLYRDLAGHLEDLIDQRVTEKQVV